MEERVYLWILGAVITLFTAAITYILKELTNIHKRIHTRNNEFAALLTKIQLNVKEVSGMSKTNEKSLTEIKNTVEELRKTLTRLSNELSRLSGFLSKGD